MNYANSVLHEYLADRQQVSREDIARQLHGCSVRQLDRRDRKRIHRTLTAGGWKLLRRRVAPGAVVRVYERSKPQQRAVFHLTTGLVDPLHLDQQERRFSLIERPTTAITILQDASQAILDRAASRDIEAERSMARTVKAFNALTGHDVSERDGWIFMAVLKAARATAGSFNADNFADGAGYFGLAGECAAEDAAAAAEATPA